LLGAALRLPFLDAPLTADEGGYAEVARLWSHGQRLYRSDWVDRPQGLLLVFRTALGAGITSAAGLRAVAAGFAVLLALIAALLGRRIGGRNRGLIAAALVALAGASPFIESFTLSGELIAGVFAAAAVLAFTFYVSTRSPGWLLVSGLGAGSAWMVKQSAFDGAVTVGLCLAFRSRRRWDIALFAAAVATPIVAGVLVSGDPRAWYDAVVGYGLHASGTGIRLCLRPRDSGPSRRSPHSVGGVRPRSPGSGSPSPSPGCCSVGPFTRTTTSSSSLRWRSSRRSFPSQAGRQPCSSRPPPP
jgi:hypothetical protein